MIKRKDRGKGFAYIAVRNQAAEAEIALQGAHVFHYRQAGEKPLLWLSRNSFFAAGKAIRGGIPVCWPWFGKHPTDAALPQHGFARNVAWELASTRESDDLHTEITLRLQSSDATRQLWPHSFELLLSITVGPELGLTLTTRNCSSAPFAVTSALHSYLAVSESNEVYVEGLAGTTYLDALTGENKTEAGNVTISGEVDRVFQGVQYPLTLHDRDRSIRINGRGSRSAVVWNPWIDKCASMTDMPDDGYRTMLCIETANALADIRRVAPGEKHVLATVLSCCKIL